MDVIDRAAGLQPHHPVYLARRLRPLVVAATQASHDALFGEPAAGLDEAERLAIAEAVCAAAGAQSLLLHYQGLQATRAKGAVGSTGAEQCAATSARVTAAQDAATAWAVLLTRQPRRGDQPAIHALKAAGLGDEAIVALGQLVGFLSYQIRVVAGLQALQTLTRPVPGEAHAIAESTPAESSTSPYDPKALVRSHGFTSETLGWRSWLMPLQLDDASDLQLAVLDESHPQARTSEYYRTLVHQPQMLRHRSAAYNTIMYGVGGAPRAERELAAMAVSVTNGCVYCTSVHAQRYAQLARRHDTVEQVFAGEGDAGSNPRERAVVAFARALTRQPDAVPAVAVQRLWAVGLTDAEVLDVLHAAAIFGWANRLMHNLGEPAPAA
jgi:uncharacterized peroxidase-related enzyme